MNGNSLICCLCRQIQLIQHTCMNVTLYGWTFNFHKVMQQQNSGAVEDFILPYSAVYLRIQKWKNYWNRYRKNKSGTFFNGPRCISRWNSTFHIAAQHCRRPGVTIVCTQTPCAARPKWRREIKNTDKNIKRHHVTVTPGLTETTFRGK